MRLLAFVPLLLVGLWLYFPTHPKFGPIRETTAYDLNEARANRLGIFLREHLPNKIVQSPHFPETFKDQPRYLEFGDWQFEWSIGGTNAGWFYFWGIDENRGCIPEKWEFAPCPETDLMAVRAAPTVFYPATSPDRAKVFGDTSSTNAIKVTAGQILFVRRTDETNQIFVAKLWEQDQNKLVVRYCIIRP
jgi:hypothetical protein